MLKFATKKPPRLKHYETGNVTRRGHGHVASGEGEGHGQYGGGVSKQDSVDNVLRNNVNANMDQYNSLDRRDEHGNVYMDGSLPRIKWKAYNVKYGKVGLENEIEIPVESTKPVGLIRNGVTQSENVRSHYNPGYETLSSKDRVDINRNVYPQAVPGSQAYTRGSGYYPPGHEYNANRHFHYINGAIHSPNQPFPDRSLSTDSNGNYGNPYSFDSTGSMSIDTMSTSGDRSSKSVSETPDYDMLIEAPQVPRKKLDNKPPVSPQKHRHVHVGRGTHGICEGPQSPPRPGSTETQMTSSLRKSPSFRTGHHVRWGPGVVNSGQHVGHPQAQQAMVNGLQGAPAPRKKKKTSLRTLLNIPKFPVSDEDFTDYGSDTSFSSWGQSRRESTDSKQSIDKVKVMPAGVAVAKAKPAKELACLQYMKQFPPLQKDSGPQPQASKGNQLKLNITSAKQDQMRSVPTLPQRQQMAPQRTTMPSETGAIRYPIMHPGTDTKNRGQVNSVRPFLINGQSGEILEYDNVDENTSQQTVPISVKGWESGVEGYVGSRFTEKGSGDKTRQNASVGPGVIPVTFDTFVTLGRPSESSVTFDTFVTHGRPYATSTPIPNGNLGYAQNLGQEFTNLNKFDRNQELRSTTGLGLKSVSEQSPVFTGASGQFPTTVTQSWKYSAGTQHAGAVPVAAYSAIRTAQEPVMMQAASFPLSHDSHVTSSGSVSGPYEMDNRSYGKLSSPPHTFMTTAPVTAAVHIPVHVSYNVSRSHDQSHDQMHSPSSPFKESGTCSVHRKEPSPDYDDGTVFSDLVARLSPGSQPKSWSARRKLEFEGSSHSGQVSYKHDA